MSNAARCKVCPVPSTHHCHLDCTVAGLVGAPINRIAINDVDRVHSVGSPMAINVERQKKYMPPSHDFGCLALMWRGVLLKRYGIDVPLDAEVVGLMMVALKINRQAGVHDPDNLLDMQGYVNTVQSVRDSMKENDHVQERSRVQETLDRIDDKGIV